MMLSCFPLLLQAAVPSSGFIDDKRRVDDGLSSSLAIMDQLRDTLRDEHSCFVKFTLEMWRRVFTPLQSGTPEYLGQYKSIGVPHSCVEDATGRAGEAACFGQAQAPVLCACTLRSV